MTTSGVDASKQGRSRYDGPIAQSPQIASVADSAHGFLRLATRSWHERVEAGFAPFDLMEIGGLTQFLQRQAAALLPLECELEKRGIQQLLPDWPERRRSVALLADLKRLGAAMQADVLQAHLPTRDHRLGALYVLEGSRLGGRILQRRVANSSDLLVRSALDYLGHQGPRQGWAAFLTLLNGIVLTERARRGLLAGAEQAFGLFHAGASSPAG